MYRLLNTKNSKIDYIKLLNNTHKLKCIKDFRKSFSIFGQLNLVETTLLGNGVYILIVS